jgi:hypothetical protein
MKYDDIKKFKDKRVRIILNNGFCYTCKIEFLNEDSVHIIDKFDKKHVFNIDFIQEISEND